MSGYHGYSMSNNALDAYERGRMPISKWTKTAILSAIRAYAPKHPLTSQLSKVPVPVLKAKLLIYTEWHHTSSHYNRTDFYALDTARLDKLTADDINAWLTEYADDKPLPRGAQPRYKGTVWWQEKIWEPWTGRKKTIAHKQAGWIEEKGSWVTVYDSPTGGHILLRKASWNIRSIKRD